MRKGKNAPVDRFGPMNCINDEDDDKTQRFQILVSLLLSSQTRDGKNFSPLVNFQSIKLMKFFT
jgi:endonuclease III